MYTFLAMHTDEIAVGPSDLSEEQRLHVREVLQSILESQYFERSKRYPALLEYAVLHTMDGDIDALNERTVASEVFGRSADFEPSNVSMVRNSFAEVRKRLALYFGEHSEAPVRIELPHGRYSAEFLFHTQSVAANVTERQAIDLPVPLNEHQWGARRRWAVAAAAAVLVAIWLAIFGLRYPDPASPLDRFWAPMLGSHEQVTIVMGAPFEGTPQPSDPRPPDDALLNYMFKLPNNPVPDIAGASSINQFLSARGVKSEIRMARSVQFSDLHRAPAVVIGASPMNPWAARLCADLRFQFLQTEDGHIHSITDSKNPADSKWQVNIDLPYDQVSHDFALITRQLNPATGQWWIGIGGTTAISTAEAEHVVLDQSAMKSFEAQFPSGWDRKNLQFVIEFTLVNGSAGGSRVLASDVW